MMSMTVHFSVDDIFEALAWLKDNKERITSIFESPCFAVLKNVHERYGVNVDCYCFYNNEEINLCDIPDSFREEFETNSTWLRFGYHADNSLQRFDEMSADEFKISYERLQSQLGRIVGEKSMTDTLRLHFFSGNDGVVSVLKENGIRRLLCADDDRVSYKMTQELHNKLHEQGTVVDCKSGIEYIRTNIRLENIKNNNDIPELIEKVKGDTLVVFTHERYLCDETIMGYLENILK